MFGEMGTRAMVLKEEGRRRYRCYYRHMDGYPRGLGADLIEALRSPFVKTWEDLAKECGLKDEGAVVSEPEEAFSKVVGDLEYIYVVRDYGKDHASLKIYRTSCPYHLRFEGSPSLPEFVFPIWFSYKEHFPAPSDVMPRMAEVERMAVTILHALVAYHSAITKRS